jgi:hypothetical protein
LNGDKLARYVKLLLRCLIAGGGALLSASHGGTYALTVWVWINVLITVCTTAEAGLSLSPAQPVETVITNPNSDPIPTQDVKRK